MLKRLLAAAPKYMLLLLLPMAMSEGNFLKPWLNFIVRENLHFYKASNPDFLTNVNVTTCINGPFILQAAGVICQLLDGE